MMPQRGTPPAVSLYLNTRKQEKQKKQEVWSSWPMSAANEAEFQALDFERVYRLLPRCGTAMVILVGENQLFLRTPNTYSLKQEMRIKASKETERFWGQLLKHVHR